MCYVLEFEHEYVVQDNGLGDAEHAETDTTHGKHVVCKVVEGDASELDICVLFFRFAFALRWFL